MPDEEGQFIDGLAVILVEHILCLEVVFLRLSFTLILFLLELVRVDLEDELQHHFDQLGRQVHQHVRLLVFLLVGVAVGEASILGQEAVFGILEVFLKLTCQKLLEPLEITEPLVAVLLKELVDDLGHSLIENLLLLIVIIYSFFVHILHFVIVLIVLVFVITILSLGVIT